MKLDNFTISDDFGAIEVGKNYYDIHNNFDFISINYNIKSRSIILCWEKGSGDWVPPNSPLSLELLFSNVSLLKCKERDKELPFTEDDSLDTLGFIYDELVDEISGFAFNRPREGANHLNLSFMSGFAMKIAAENVKCIIK